MSSLRKFSGDRRLSDSDMPPAKAQRRQVRKRCHFDRREKSFLDPSHSLGMTGMGSSPLRLGAFAGDNSAFGCGCSPTGEPLFPSEVWEKACTTMLRFFAACANFARVGNFGFGYSSRQVAKTPSFRKFLASYLAPLRPFGYAQDMLCGRYFRFLLVAALPRWGFRDFRGEHIFPSRAASRSSNSRKICPSSYKKTLKSS